MGHLHGQGHLSELRAIRVFAMQLFNDKFFWGMFLFKIVFLLFRLQGDPP